MLVRFWGTRGSVARPGPSTLRHGGNTSCVEVRADDGTLVLLDCGTGAYEFARSHRDTGLPRRGHLLIGHTHWDHIQGFPFFDPLFDEASSWDFYAPGGRGRDLESTLAGQMVYEYHPLPLRDVLADVRFHDLTEGLLDCGGIRVRTHYLNHPALTLGYRLEADGATLVYSSDHEPHSLHPLNEEPGAIPVHYEDLRHIGFLRGADLVIHDAQYTLAEYADRAGWGHTPAERAVDYAIAAGVARLALYHHDPARDDQQLDELVEQCRKRAALGAHVPDVFAAREGQEIELPRRERATPRPVEPSESALLAQVPRRAASVLIVEDDPDMRALLKEALAAEQLRLLTASDGDEAVELALRERPSLMLLDLNIPRRDGLEVCRHLRGAAEERIRDMPILVLTGVRRREEDVVTAFEAGATDFLTKPIKPTLVRSRVRGWLMRTRPD